MSITNQTLNLKMFHHEQVFVRPWHMCQRNKFCFSAGHRLSPPLDRISFINKPSKIQIFLLILTNSLVGKHYFSHPVQILQ